MDTAGENASSEGHVTLLAKHPALSRSVESMQMLKSVVPFRGRLRPLVGQCCEKCTPESLALKLLHNTPSLGFQNLTRVKETYTRYHGWLARRVCCVLFVWGREVQPSFVGDRWLRIQGSERVKQALVTRCFTDEVKVKDEPEPEVRDRIDRLRALVETFVSPCVLRLVSWMLLKFFGVFFHSVQVNKDQITALHRATRLGSPLVYVSVRQSALDQVLITLTLFCNNLRLPYTIHPDQVRHTLLRRLLQRLGIILLPEGTDSEEDAEMDSLYSPLMTSMIGELLRDGCGLNFSLDRGHGVQWLGRVRQALVDQVVPDVGIVPVAVSYDYSPRCFTSPQAGVMSVLRFALSLLKGDHRGSVRIHFAQAFSLKEMCNSSKCRVDGGRPLQDLLLPSVQHSRSDIGFEQRDVSWLFPATLMPDLPDVDRQHTVTLALHLMHSSMRCLTAMSTSLMSCLLLHKHRQVVNLSQLCEDFCWLMEEVLFRKYDVGFGGSLVAVVHYAISLLRPCLFLAVVPPTGVPIVVSRQDPDSVLVLIQNCHLLTHVFIHEAVGACAVIAVLRETVSIRGREELDFKVVLENKELFGKILQITHFLSAGHKPPCVSAQDFARDVMDSMVHCGILVVEEDASMCEKTKQECVFSWEDSDDSYSDGDDVDSITYKLSNEPSHCPDLLFFFCRLLGVELRALCWALESLHFLPLPLTETECLRQLHTHLKNRAQLDRKHYESTSIELVRMVLHTLIDLGVLTEDQPYLDSSLLFSDSAYLEKLLKLFSQFMLE